MANDTETESPIEALASYLTEGEVGFHSAWLAMSEGSSQHKRAKRFFALRQAFGIVGYPDKDQAVAAIRRALEKD